MKKYLIVLVTLCSMTSAFAIENEVEICYSFDVPPLVAIGSAPVKRVYAQFSSLVGQNQSMVKIVSPDTGIGIAAYVSSCETINDSVASCTNALIGSGEVQINTSSKTIGFQYLKLELEKSTSAKILLGSVKNLNLTEIDCEEFRKISAGL